MADVFGIDFRDQNSESRYPFADSASLVSADGTLAFLPSTFIDASIYPIGISARAYISSVVVTAATITIIIGDALNVKRATAVFSKTSLPDSIAILDAQGRPAGILVSTAANLALLATWPLGTHTFKLGATEFVSSCVIPLQANGVEAVVAPDGTLLTGNVWLVGDNGVVVREENGNIRIDAVGEPLFVRAQCDPTDTGQTLFTTPGFVRTINGCPPDAQGNYNISAGSDEVSDPILRIYPGDGGLIIAMVGQLIAGN